mgnify:CR=1 FL=1
MSNNLNASSVNFNIETRSTYIMPIVDEQITDTYVDWLNDKKINEFLEVRHVTQTKQTVIDYINTLRNTDGCDMFAVFSKKSDVHLGNLTITCFDRNGNGAADFGIMIGDEVARSRGVGAEVHIAFLEFIFSFKSIDRVNGNAASNNLIACKTLESIGYTKEGVRRNFFPLENGGKCDVHLYGYLKDEWFQRRTRLSAFVNNVKIVKMQR